MKSGSGVILLVDDSEDGREVVRDLLEESGYQVVEAPDGREALTQLRSGLRPSLVLLDLTLPDMDGWELLAAIRSDSELARLPVVIVSGDEPRRGEGRRPSGAFDAYLRKPNDPINLLETIKRHARPFES